MEYPRIKFSYKFIFALAILALIILIALFIIDTKKVAKAQNQIKIFPISYNIESSGEITWQNPQNAFNQDLSDNASFSDFNEENSAFIQGNIEEQTTTTTTPIEETTTTTTTTIPLEPTTTIPQETTTTAESTITTIPESTTTTEQPTTTTTLPPEETTTTTNPSETTTTTEPISFLKNLFQFLTPKAKAEETTTTTEPTTTTTESTTTTPVTSSLFFSNFYLGEDFFDQIIPQNIQLRFSLAGKGQEGDKLILSYFYTNEWQNLGELDLVNEISNNINGGYFLYALPIFENPQDLQNLKIKFEATGSLKQKVYLDSVWLEIDYGENLHKASLIDVAENDYSNSFQATSKPLTHQKTKLSRKIKINKDSEHSCLVKPFQIILSQGEIKSVVILLNQTSESYQEVILGDLPIGIKAYFTNNNDSVMSGNNLSNQLSLYLEADFGSQKGSFSIPVIFGERENNSFQDTICQFNLIIK